jgi:hypothetical protein
LAAGTGEADGVTGVQRSSTFQVDQAPGHEEVQERRLGEFDRLVDAESVTVQALALLARRGEVDPSLPRQAIDKYQLLDVRAADPGSGLGES